MLYLYINAFKSIYNNNRKRKRGHEFEKKWGRGRGRNYKIILQFK